MKANDMPEQTGAGRSFGLDAHFLDTSGGRVFAVHHRPADVRGHILCIPPFNEEMNRCRSMMTLQASALAAIGIGTLIIDLHGTGDADGDHVDARWNNWLANLHFAIDWLSERGGCLALLAVRSGMLLAVEALRTHPAGQAMSLLGWQPVADGKQYFTQFLRMKIAANMDRSDLPKETTASMRDQLAEGHPIEVAGYEIHPDLAQAFDKAKLVDHPPPPGTSVLWLEHQTQTASVPSPASARVIERWAGEGVAVDVQGFEGQAFWQLHERASAPAAVAQSTAWLAQRLGKQ